MTANIACRHVYLNIQLEKEIEMLEEKNILVNRGIPRTPSLSNNGFGSNWDHSTITINADLGRDGIDIAKDWVIEGNLYTETTYKENIKNIVRITDTELANTKAYVRATAKEGTDALVLELNALGLLLSNITTDHQKQRTTANLFYGHDPLTHKGRDPYMKGFDVPFRISEKDYIKAAEQWNASYAAAYHAKFLAEQMKLLNARIATQNKTIADAKAKAAAAQAKVQAEAKRVAEERARLEAEAQRKAAAEKAAAQAKAQADAKRMAEELARKTAEAEAKRVAEEQARLAVEEQLKVAAEAAAQAKALADKERTATIKARKAARAEAKRNARRRRLAAKAARLQAETQTTRRTATAAQAFRLSGSVAVAGPAFSVAGASLAANPTTTSAITAALRVAVTAISETIAATAVPAVAGFAALLYSPKLANGELPERYALSTPLSDLAPTQHHDLHAIAAAGGTVDLPVRLTSQATADGQSEILVINTDGVTHPSKVRVLPVTYNAQQNLYTATTEDTPPRSLTWTPVVQPGNSSTAFPAEPPGPPAYTGASVTPVVGRIDPFPEISLNSFNDYVFVFPIDSGLPPLYVMFRDRREDPGIALGSGTPISGVWTDAASKGEGAPIPSQIADQLRGKKFRRFRKFRESFWKAAAGDPILSQHFDRYNLGRMKRGLAAIVNKNERIGRRYTYELHHIKYISHGGEIYDLDNINLMTPKRHIEIHREHKQ
ncbi:MULTISPECIES: S-type pyocin domain-containing protein [unclassified Pseudomonas]|uniref:S-type pyocin domain-containing protein n=2 Tax=unclassified Pseudomonas TaxID=196821 RepID=UPI0011A47E92|nr:MULTISPECIES: S-type pyocin domain-containing protein [unclassified Pseudomonas]